MKSLNPKNHPLWAKMRVLNIIYSCKTKIGERCYLEVGSSNHCVYLGPVRFLCPVLAVRTIHNGDSQAIRRLWGCEVGCLLLANKEKKLGDIIWTHKCESSY